MAAKSKAKPKGKVKAAAKKANIHRAKPKGLQLTTAQQAAYNKAFSATARAMRNRIALQAAATARRKGLLGAARTITRQYAKAYRSAQAAAVAANATRMTWVQAKLAHQNTALLARAELNMYNHANLLGRAQFAQAGVKVYAHQAVMATVTQKQAMSAEQAFLRRVIRTARKAGRTTRKFNRGPNSPAIASAAKAAGMAAARSVKGAKSVTPRPSKTGRPRGRPKGSGKSSQTPPAKAAATKAVKAAAKQGSASKKAPAAKAKARTAPMFALAAAAQAKRDSAKKAAKLAWVGDEFTPNCIVVALANHLLHVKQVLADEASIRELTEACPEEPTIEQVLWTAWLIHWPRNDTIHVKNFQSSPWRGDPDIGGLIIGYETEYGDHAALALADGRVVSWGTVTDRDREVPIEEAWEVLWER